MSGGIPIRARIYTTDTPIDPVQLGGIGWHEIEKKFGIWDGTQFCWYPTIDPVNRMMVLNSGQRLAGKDINGNINPIVVSFDRQGKLDVLDTSNNDAILASISALGITFANGNQQSARPGGQLNKISHPGFLPSLFPSAYVFSDTPGFVGPNTYLWKKASGSQGQAKVKYTYSAGLGAQLDPSAEAYSIEFTATGQLAGIGLRSWLFEPSLAYDGVSNHNKVFFSVKGPTNQVNTVRIGRAGAYATQTFMGTGQWQRLSLDLAQFGINQNYANNAAYEPFAVDWFYNTSGGTWYLGEPCVQKTDIISTEVYQYRSLAERMAIADSFYWKSSNIYMQGQQKQNIVLPTSFPILSNNANYDVVALSAEAPIAVTEKTNDSFTLSTSNTSITSQWKTQLVVGYRGPLTDII